jgi:hypothetical protein
MIISKNLDEEFASYISKGPLLKMAKGWPRFVVVMVEN